MPALEGRTFLSPMKPLRRRRTSISPPPVLPFNALSLCQSPADSGRPADETQPEICWPTCIYRKSPKAWHQGNPPPAASPQIRTEQKENFRTRMVELLGKRLMNSVWIPFLPQQMKRNPSPNYPPHSPDQRPPLLLLQRMFPHPQHPPAFCSQRSVHQPVALLVGLSFLFPELCIGCWHP